MSEQFNTLKQDEIIIAVTGHRGDKLGGYSNNSPLNVKIRQRLEDYLEMIASQNPTKRIVAVSGMALGADTLWVLAAINMRQKYPNIVIHAAVPFHGQEKVWPPESQEIYRNLLHQCNSVHYVMDSAGKKLSKGQAAYAMHQRNEYMCNIAHILIAVYDGVSQSGGTYECLKYAKQGRFVKEGEVVKEHHYSSSLKQIYYLRFREIFQDIMV